ncbi:hypothetical protein PENSPDRAFT_755393 [Peniophora sp. CONT]|nr:hypothetical protein PENSPDRAFT_755393 [Peniophora sp. CONT]
MRACIVKARPRSVLLDGYVAAVFEIQEAFQYWNFFLDHPEDSRPLASYLESDGITHPSISPKNPVLLDYKVVTDRGSVVPAQTRRFLGTHRVPLSQKQTLPDGRKDYPLPRLRPPVFFKNVATDGLGISVDAALNGSALRDMADLDQVVEITDKDFVVFEVDWPGYPIGKDFVVQQQFNLRAKHSRTTMRWAIECAVQVVDKFFTRYTGAPSSQDGWKLGYGNHSYVITRDKVLVIGLMHVTAGRWRPILQLDGIHVPGH